MKTLYFFTFVIIMQSFIILNGTSAKLQIVFKHINCNPRRQYFRHIYCALVEPQRLYITIHFNLLRDIGAGLMTHLRVDILHNQKPLTSMDFDIDACNFLTAKRQNNFLQILRNSFDNYGNVTKKCPLKKDVTYGLFNLTADISKVPYVYGADVLFDVVFKMPSGSIVAEMDIGAKLTQGK